MKETDRQSTETKQRSPSPSTPPLQRIRTLQSAETDPAALDQRPASSAPFRGDSVRIRRTDRVLSDSRENRLQAPVKRRIQLRELLDDRAADYEQFEWPYLSSGLLCRHRKSVVERLRPKARKQFRPHNGFLLSESLLALLVCMVSGWLLFASVFALNRSAAFHVDYDLQTPTPSEQIRSNLD